MNAIRRRVFVSGRVQGVWFRGACQKQARELGVTGWVRNAYDGRVEAVFEGTEAAVDRMVAWCRQGPRRACVERVDVRSETPTGEPSFHVR